MLRIVFVCVELLCLLVIAVGVAIWFTPHPFFIKLVYSAFAVLTGIIFGSIGVHLWLNLKGE